MVKNKKRKEVDKNGEKEYNEEQSEKMMRYEKAMKLKDKNFK